MIVEKGIISMMASVPFGKHCRVEIVIRKVAEIWPFICNLALYLRPVRIHYLVIEGHEERLGNPITLAAVQRHAMYLDVQHGQHLLI